MTQPDLDSQASAFQRMVDDLRANPHQEWAAFLTAVDAAHATIARFKLHDPPVSTQEVERVAAALRAAAFTYRVRVRPFVDAGLWPDDTGTIRTPA